MVAYLIANKSKPFIDGELIKRCIESVADIICPGKKGVFLKSVCLTRRTEEIGKSIERSLQSKAANFEFYALAMGHSTDAAHMTQPAIFIRGVDDEYDVTEEMASLVPLKDTTKSRVLYKAVKENVEVIFFVHCQHTWCCY